MTTMMEHPKHGRHPAVGHEIERMKAEGWTVRAPKVVVDVAERVEEAAKVADTQRIKRAYNRKA